MMAILLEIQIRFQSLDLLGEDNPKFSHVLLVISSRSRMEAALPQWITWFVSFWWCVCVCVFLYRVRLGFLPPVALALATEAPTRQWP